MKRLLPIWFVLQTCHAQAQEFTRRDYDLEKLADEIFTARDIDLNYTEFYENLANTLSNPLDLNKVSQDQLRALFVLREEQVNSFLAYRLEYGPILSLYELQAIPGWDQNTLDHILPFVMVVNQDSKLNSSLLRRIAKEKNNYLVLRYERVIELRKGFRSSQDSAHRYVGSPDKAYLRYRVSRPGDFSLGITAEKDPGEPWLWRPQKYQPGFDFLSLHVQVQDKGRVKNLIVGDYQCQFGQGLILGSTFGLGKNSETITTIRRSNLGFMPYTSTDESRFMRGVAASYLLFRRIQLHGFLSKKRRDGLVVGTDLEDSYVSTLSTTGLHRTPAEIQSKEQVSEADFGGVIQFQQKGMDAGFIFHQKDFGQPLVPDRNPYNQFTHQGKTNQHAGFYLNHSWANVTFFSEFSAGKQDKGIGCLAGLLGNFTHKLEMALLLRNYSIGFHPYYANAISENTAPQNEAGFYWGGKYTVSKQYAFSGYLDLFSFPWLRYRVYSPSEGYEWLVRFNYAPSKAVKIFFQTREERKDRNLPQSENLYHTSAGVKRNYWINCDYQVSPGLGFKTRIQGSEYKLGGKTTHGAAFVQDVTISAKRLSLSIRYALFDTDDFDNRQYLYEKDVWLSYTMPAFDGVGIKNYMLLQYSVSQKVDCWIRWSQIRYADRSEIGSGLEEIDGNTRNDVKFQTRIRF